MGEVRGMWDVGMGGRPQKEGIWVLGYGFYQLQFSVPQEVYGLRMSQLQLLLVCCTSPDQLIIGLYECR